MANEIHDKEYSYNRMYEIEKKMAKTTYKSTIQNRLIKAYALMFNNPRFDFDLPGYYEYAAKRVKEEQNNG